MDRSPSTNVRGSGFDGLMVQAVWDKAQFVPGYDPALWRKDRCGAFIGRYSYGTTGDFGWEIDHDYPVALRGTDDLSNLQPLHWRNNRHKGDSFPRWMCEVTSNN